MGQVVKLPQPDDWKNLLEVFLFEKKAEGKAPRTIHDYKAHVSSFFKRFPPPIYEMEKWWYIIIAIGSERLSRRMGKKSFCLKD